jgi:hypothetical protein
MSTITTNTFQELATGDSVGAKYVVYGTAKAWANLNGTGTIALRGSFGISSIIDVGTGNYTVVPTNSFASTGYTEQVTSDFFSYMNTASRTVSAIQVGAANSSGAPTDANFVLVSAFGDLA